MLVYGDGERQERARVKLACVRESLELAARLPPGLERHATLVAALIEAGELAQGIADAQFRADGEIDRRSPEVDAAMALTMACARRCVTSWAGGFVAAGIWPEDTVAQCAAVLPDTAIGVKRPEGYAFYALYPESYWEASRRLPHARWQVIGVRSIGTSLACMVAVGLDAKLPQTVRPSGPPFERRVIADAACMDRDAEAFAIVDEGPGQSGSSLAAVARWLLDLGIAEQRMHVFASHRRGPGAQASAAVRAWWARAEAEGRLHVCSFDELVRAAEAPAHRLETWVADLIGALDEPLRELGGGAWRALHAHPSGDLPPVHPWQERRKFLALANGRRWLVKFAGLGRHGALRLAQARVLGEAGFTPAPVGGRHGFIVERWRGDGAPLSLPIAGELRTRLLDRVGAYLAFRAHSFPAARDSGATIDALLAMARQNTGEALGAPFATAWDAWRPVVGVLSASVSRIATDNRMHAWEWLVCADAIVKTDAIDHHAAHDLVGCQDVAWDVAGAVVEFGLSPDEERTLVERVSRFAGRPPPTPLIRFLHGCYLAFQLGHYEDAHRAACDASEAGRLKAARDRYAARLRAALASGAVTPRES